MDSSKPDAGGSTFSASPFHLSDSGETGIKMSEASNNVGEERSTSRSNSRVSESKNARLSNYNPMHPQNSKYLTSFLLINTMIGSGILNQPYVFMKSGIIGGLGGFAVASYLTWVCVNMLTESGLHTKTFEYQGIARLAYGAAGEQFVDINIALSCFGALLGYIIVVGSTISDLLLSWGCTSRYCEEVTVTVATVSLFVAPICLFRHFGHLAFLSVFSIGTIWTVMGLVLIGGPMMAVHDKAVNEFNTVGFLSSFGSIIFALTIAAANFQAFVSTEKEARTSTGWRQITGWAVGLGALMCVAMGIAGYMAFKDETDGVILSNFSGHQFDVFKVMVAMHLIFYIPINFVIMRYSIVKVFMGGQLSENLPEATHATLTLILLIITTGFVVMLYAVGMASGDAFALTLNLTGGIMGSLVSFVVPSVIYQKLVPVENSPYMYQAAGVIKYLGVVIMLIVVVMTFVDATS